MFYEIKGCTYRDVDGFFEKYFEGRRWSHKTEAIYNAVSNQYMGGRWTDFPDPPDEDAVWGWLSRFQDEHLSDSRGVLYTTESTSDLTGGEAQRQLDLFVKRRGIETSGKHDWKDVRVIGELKRYIRDAFTAQPTRRFIHGFVLHDTTMELWVFDRSGPYSSGEFDIHEESQKFIRAIAGYAMMDDEELGLDTFTELDDKGRFITISEDATGKGNRMRLDETSFVKQRAVVPGCYYNIDENDSGERFNKQLATNLIGPINLTRALLPHFRQRRAGTIVFIGSYGGWRGQAGAAPYCVSKFALEGLVECLADELAPFNIRTLLVEAGMFRTDLFAEGNRKSEPPAIEDYASIHKKQAQGVAAIHGKQAGDPKKAVERILDVVRGEGVAEGRSMPKRLPLGKDTLGIIRTKCEETLKLCEEWEGVATSTDF
ncbi:MAG: hypothetical protein LQ352_000115 [Teloschistes flavicans]|nr:MAG: hypothetical protein LQ352_000115 [Teloschistes flavicans]